MIELDARDVEAVAKSRVARMERKRGNYYLIGLLTSFVVGLLCLRIPQYGVWLGNGLIVLGLIVYLLYLNAVNKKQRLLMMQLKREWQHESN